MHCCWVYSLWHPALSLMGISRVQPLKFIDASVAQRRKDEKELSSRSSQVEPYGYLVDYLEGKEPAYV